MLHLLACRSRTGALCLHHLKNKQIQLVVAHRQRLLPLIQSIYIPTTSRMMASQQPDQADNPNRKELKGQFTDADPKMPAKQRLKNLIVVYGPTALVLHIGLSLTFLSLTYLVVRYGFDVPAFLQRYDFLSESYMRIIASGGTFGLAYALYKSTMPFRVLVTIALTPPFARLLQRTGIIAKRPGT